MKLKIISGGQTGVDRGALDAALEAGIEHGGFCPKGRRSEDGMIPEHYTLTETTTDSYPARTSMNVRMGHGTLLLVHGRSALLQSVGTKLTWNICKNQQKAWHAADPRRSDHAARVAAWLEKLWREIETPPGWLEGLEREEVLVLNVAGPRESKAPGIQKETAAFLASVLLALRKT